jgi:uncharacterized protein YnzC (UPF0291/DUF896 family)
MNKREATTSPREIRDQLQVLKSRRESCKEEIAALTQEMNELTEQGKSADNAARRAYIHTHRTTLRNEMQQIAAEIVELTDKLKSVRSNG